MRALVPTVGPMGTMVETFLDDALRLVDPGQRSRVSKFQPCLPPDIEHGLNARETMNVGDAIATLAVLVPAVEPREEG